MSDLNVMDEFAQMIFGFQCCSAANEEKESHLADKLDVAKQKKSRSSRRSKHELKSKLAGQSTSDESSITTHGSNDHEPIYHTYETLSCKSLRPPSASIAADNVLVGASRCPASGSLNSRSAFAPSPPPEPSPTRLRVLPRVIPATPAPHLSGAYGQDILDLGK